MSVEMTMNINSYDVYVYLSYTIVIASFLCYAARLAYLWRSAKMEICRLEGIIAREKIK